MSTTAPPQPTDPTAPTRADAAVPSDESGLRATLREARDFGALRRSKYGLLPAVTLGLIGFFQSFDNRAFSLASPDIARELSIDVGDIIGIQTMVGTVLVFTGILGGYYADRVRRVPFVAIGTTLSGIFSIVMSRARSFVGLAAPRVIDDSAEYTSSIPQFSLLADYYPHTVRGKVFVFLGLLSKAARLLAPVLVGYCVVELGFRTSFVMFGAPLVVLGILSFFVLREPVRGYWERKAMGASDEVALREEEPQSFGEGFRATFGVRTIRRITIANVFLAASDEIVALFFVFYLAEEYGLNALERGLVFLPTVAAALIGGFVGGGLIDRFTRVNPNRVMQVLGIFGLLMSPWPLVYLLEPPLWVLVGAGVVTGFGASLVGPASAVITTQVIPARVRTFGVQLTALAVLPTTILFFPIARNVFRDYGYDGIWWFTLPFAVIGGVIYLTASSFFELDMRAAFAQSMAEEEHRQAKALGRSKLLVARNLDVHYDGVQVLFGVDFDVDEGEILALLGTNGAGKSTVLRAISGLQPATAGGVYFDGRDITHMPANEVAARGLVQMPGGRGIFPSLSVRENLLLGSWLVDDPVVVRERLSDVLEIFPALRERAETLAGTLSGGEQQQLSLAQAFLANPKLLLIDELSLGLSPVVVAQLIEIVKELNRRGVTIIVVEQSVNVALTVADRAIFLEKGEVRFEGQTRELLTRGDILRAVYVKGTGALTDGVPAAARRTEREQRALTLGDAPPVLEVEGLVKRYGGVRAVSGVSFALREGEVLGLIGPNGAGKTTIFDLISGHQRADEGVVSYEGVDISDLPPEQRAQRKLIRRFQDARLFPSLTVEEALLVALEQRLEVKSAVLNAVAFPGARRAERRAHRRADRLIGLLELEAYRDKFVKELSTGLRRIVDLACVLATEPKVLLLDEPSSGIAQAEAEQLGPLLRRVRFETGCSILIIEHDMPLISAVSDELLALDQGETVVRGVPDVVLNDERVVESYLGTSESSIQRSGSLV
jgi:branched-chain amino acid transport system ATP-binding protein